MGSKMLIDAAHREETRVVVFRGNRIEEFDYESANRKQLKGNIYLAKVTRVEPSLQAAFVEYGGNRHGFLAFSEIHPDYYQIPVADREALLREEQEEAIACEPEEAEDEEVGADESDDENGEDVHADDSENVESVDEDDPDAFEAVGTSEEEEEEAVDEEEAPRRRRRRQRRYRIQEVIKRRQIILVQVVKEERGNKGAALTTYLSLAGRYCVLMPNTARGGGISRKISDPKDRKRLKDVVQAMNVPDGAGLIVRTAGASRTKAEIKRDFDYLLRLWGNIRDLTLKSTAPSLVYEEGNLIKRSIRDLYNKEVDEVLVEGEEPYKEAKAFMKMLMPSHARNVKLYNEDRPLFSRFQVEGQLDALYSPQVTLPSGGYLVLNQTEALVSIDINSGKATREHSIESTALKTNLEAAVEISRQLRLRDLAGLVVIDFIDMEERRNNRAVERKLKEALKSDRARIQVGRISHFGLLEMSRQRMRQSMLEGTTKPCPHCEGTGLIRSLSSCALSVLRTIEDHLINRKAENLRVRAKPDVAFYILNEKRENLVGLETTWGVSIMIEPSETVSASECEIARLGNGAPAAKATNGAVNPAQVETDEASEGDGKKRRRRRRGRRRKSDQTDEAIAAEAETEDEAPQEAETASEETGDEEEPKKKKPRRRRGRGKKKADEAEEVAADAEETVTEDAATEEAVTEEAIEADSEKEPKKKKPARKRKPRKKVTAEEAPATEDVPLPEPENQGNGDASPEPPTEPEPEVEAEPDPEPEKRTWQPPAATVTDTGPAKKGWWRR